MLRWAVEILGVTCNNALLKVCFSSNNEKIYPINQVLNRINKVLSKGGLSK